MDENLNSKNQYFLKKQEKEKVVKSAQREKLMKKTLRWITVAVAVGLLGWWLFSSIKTTSINKPVPGQYFQAQSRDHIRPGAGHPVYNSNPPTGGWHYDQPVQSGIYDKEFPDEQLIHNLEHSHIWIAYKPDLPADQIEKLADIAKGYGSKIIMTPRPANDSAIALVAWEYLLKMDNLDEALARDFIEAYRGLAGPEKIADFGFKDFRNNK